MRALVIGVDPGRTTGVAALTYVDGRMTRAPWMIQVHNAEGVLPMVRWIFSYDPLAVPFLAVEHFVVGRRAARSADPGAGQLTRMLVANLTALRDEGINVSAHLAGLVKPWATDRRLYEANLIDCTKGMHHARDAARHALYTAVHDGITRDPMSTRSAVNGG